MFRYTSLETRALMAADSQSIRGAPRLGYTGDPHGPAYDAWREEFCRRVMCGDVAPLAAGPVRCDVTAVPLPGLKMSGAAGSPMQFVATGADRDSALAFVLATAAPMRITVGGRSVDLEPMGTGLADAAHEGADVSQLAEGRFKSLFIERRTLLAYCPDAEDRIARPLAPNPALAAMLHQYYDLAVQHAPGLDALAQSAVSQHLLDLVVLMLGTGRDETELAQDRGLAAARLEAIKADILSRLGDGRLTLADLAQRHRASPRAIQMLFERAGTTFSEFVLEQRLMRAARLLRDPLRRASKISDIAYLSGFNDVSYFHRSFRRRFGMTPLDAKMRRSEKE
ncbi:helix-turn-helix transcriptional regulator [Bradyrhizobium sp. AUGA SZCCT0042]|uniref:helix-turn-helix transcriptional regulator n=2 Tax=Bradyrhizobium TaxID=374 RepID=UPI002899880D|nr:helix-turn-helix transcriptional regulator [Bradyrhizobium sp. AUGA SZCCT0042]